MKSIEKIPDPRRGIYQTLEDVVGEKRDGLFCNTAYRYLAP